MSRTEKTTFFLFNLGLALLIAILVTTPSIFFLKDHLIGYPHDGFEYIYKFWWFKKAIFDFGISPANTILMNFPVVDQNLTIITSPILPLLSLPFSFLNINLFGYNILLLASFILNMGLMAVICYEIFKNKFAATLGAMIFAFNCNTIAHAIGGHLAQISVYPILLFIICYFYYINKRSYCIAIITGIIGGFCLLVDLKVTAYSLLPIYIVLTIFNFRRNENRFQKSNVIQFVLLNSIMALIAIPFYKQLLFSGIKGDIGYLYQPGAIKHSASLLSFVIPPPESFLIKVFPSLSSISETIALPGWHENVFFIGWVILVFAVIGAIFLLKDKMFFKLEIILLTIFSFFMVLGPYLKIVIEPISFTFNSKEYWLSMPYFYFSKIPFMDLGRTPSRYMTTLWFGLSICTAYGINKVIKSINKIWIKRIVTSLLVFTVFVEVNFTFPFPVSPVSVPEFYLIIASDEEDFAVLDLPLRDYRCERQQMYFATIHQHPIVGGIITRRSESAEDSMKEIENYLELQNLNQTRNALENLQIKYVVFHKKCSNEPNSDLETENLILRLDYPILSNDEIDVFKVY